MSHTRKKKKDESGNKQIRDIYNKISTKVVLLRHQTKEAESKKKNYSSRKRRENVDNKGENVQGQNLKGRISQKKEMLWTGVVEEKIGKWK